MGPLISLIVIITLSVLITKIASELLVHTGLSRETSKFQARSAFSGVGFTTKEAENIVNHPVRRRIVMSLMLIGNVGIISAIASLMLTFVDTSLGFEDNALRILIIIATMAALWCLSRTKWIEYFLVRIIKKALNKFTTLNIHDYVELLDLQGEYEITVLKVREGDWLENKKVKELQLRKEGVNLIGIQRKDGVYVGTPKGETKIVTHDQLIIYGRKSNLDNLEKRKQDFTGEQDHQKAVKEQDKEMVKQNIEDKESK